MSEYDLCKEITHYYSKNINNIVKNTEKSIEFHNVITMPKQLVTLREKANSIESVFTVIEREQDHLFRLHGKIKYLVLALQIKGLSI